MTGTRFQVRVVSTLAVLGILFAPVHAAAQVASARFVGNVTDESGAASRRHHHRDRNPHEHQPTGVSNEVAITPSPTSRLAVPRRGRARRVPEVRRERSRSASIRPCASTSARVGRWRNR